MLNRTPPNNTNTTNTLNAYRKRRQMFKGPFLIYTLAGILLLAGIGLVVWTFSGGDNPVAAMLATETPTPTLTSTPTSTITPSATPTITETPTITITPTPTGPIAYTIVEGDTLPAIAEKFGLGSDGVLLILEANPTIMENNGIYFVGQTLSIPPVGTQLKTSTPVPSDLRRGTKIDYQVLPGDTLAGIAAKFNSKEEEIITLNKIENANALQAGQILQIPVNLVTATATLPPTSTPVTPTVAGQPAPTATAPAASGACVPAENAAFVTELQTLINNARTSNSLPALTLNDKLVAAAKSHAVDMVCNNYFSHIGLNGFTQEFRVAAQGYTGTFALENIYALPTATAKSAFDWWMNDPVSRANILNATATEFGVAYQSSDKSLLGGYFVVVFAKP